MKRTLSIAAVALLAAAAGCSPSTTKPSSSLQSNSSVTQLTPPAQNTTPTESSQAEQVSTMDTSTPNMASEIQGGGSTSSSVGGKYTVKAGDTLFRIAATHYGHGGEWKKIAAANPGLDPKHLRVGQSITLP